MPQHTIDPVVLAAMIIVRLQTIVSREVAPGDTAVVTVGSCHAGTRSNVIPDFAVLELNVRSYSSATRQRMLGAAATERVARAFAAHFADRATEIPKQTVSEDFSKIPDAVGAPYCYWGFGFTDRDTYLAAEKDGHLEDLPTNHSPRFLAPAAAHLRIGTEALITVALAWLAP
jgi:hippurate hydrolase